MAQVEKYIDVRAPVSEVFRTLNNVEEYPNFMEGVREVRRLSPSRTRWVENWGGARNEWDARLTATTDRRLAWASESGARRQAEIELEPVGRDVTRVYYSFGSEPDGRSASPSRIGASLENRVVGDLRRLKQYIEDRRTRSSDFAMPRSDNVRDTVQQRDRGLTEMMKTPRVNPLEWASASIVTIGGVNCALDGVFGLDIIKEVFGKHSVAAKATYALIGVSAVYTMFGLVRSDLMTRRHDKEHHSEGQMRQSPEYEYNRSLV
jgi:uncharacterized membrane protein YuzA (DUF378 family)/carbon monoxide dehydrogenase subunit G